MRELTQTNVAWLRQALDVIHQAGHAVFATHASAHLRPIIEFYECFPEGAATLHIDYDARRRDASVERSTAIAAARVHQLIARLEALDALTDSLVWVRPEDSHDSTWLTSSIGRELQVLASHT